jgi:hypothetical protein
MVAANRKIDGSLEILMTEAELATLGLADGDSVTATVHVAREQPASEELAEKVRRTFKDSWARNEAGYRYLAGR